jgi:hypothetical protein
MPVGLPAETRLATVLTVRRGLLRSLPQSIPQGRHEPEGQARRPARAVSAVLLGVLLVALSLPSTACGSLSCGDVCFDQGACGGQYPKPCSMFAGCEATSSCVCAVVGTCSTETTQTCEMTQDEGACATLSGCVWLTFCHRTKDCMGIGDAPACQAAGCEWEHNCN